VTAMLDGGAVEQAAQWFVQHGNRA